MVAFSNGAPSGIEDDNEETTGLTGQWQRARGSVALRHRDQIRLDVQRREPQILVALQMFLIRHHATKLIQMLTFLF